MSLVVANAAVYIEIGLSLQYSCNA